jgi:hypothetical protein
VEERGLRVPHSGTTSAQHGAPARDAGTAEITQIHKGHSAVGVKLGRAVCLDLEKQNHRSPSIHCIGHMR